MSLPALAERTVGGSGEALALPGILVAVAVATWWVLRRAPRSWPGAATSMALVMLAFLLFNKQAFTNYYMLAVAMCWLGVALREGGVTLPSTPRSGAAGSRTRTRARPAPRPRRP